MRVKGPSCPSAADVKLRAWSLRLDGPREGASVGFPTPSLLFFFLSPLLNGYSVLPWLTLPYLQCRAAVHSRNAALLTDVLSCCFRFVIPPLHSFHSAGLTFITIHIMFSLPVLKPSVHVFLFVEVFSLSSCSITFVFTPLQSLLTVWYPREEIAKKNWPCFLWLSSLSFEDMCANCVWALWLLSFELISFNFLSSCNMSLFVVPALFLISMLIFLV